MKILSILAVVVLVLIGGTPFARGQFVPLDQNMQIWGSGGAGSGTSLFFDDKKGTVTENFEVLISGTAPASTTINVYGCMRGGTCSSSLANTTSTSSTLIAPSTNALYDQYKATVSWTGGDSTTKITINRSGTVAKSGSGSGSGVSSVGLTLNGSSPCGAAAVTGSPVTTSGVLNINFTGTNGDIVTFNSSNCPVDSGTLLSSLAPKASPTFSGTVTLPDGSTSTSSLTTLAATTVGSTQSAKDNSTKLATTAYVDRPTGLTTGTSVTLTPPRQYFICTGTCTITVPVPAAGYEFCVQNDVGVSTAITFAAIGSSAMYGKTDQSAYGTAGTGTLVATAVAGNKMCLLGKDSTHYNVASFNGTWTAN